MFKTKKILIIDDEEQSRLYLASILNELHPEFKILMAATPNEALFIFKTDCVDLLLLDVEMPGMTGLELLTKIRITQQNTPAIFVSGFKKATFIQQAMRLNAVDYIDKPVDPIELENALQKVFEQTNEVVEHSETKKETERFCVLSDSGEVFLNASEILYFNTLKRYSMVYLVDGTHKLIRENLESLSKKLAVEYFLRVSRQHIVNKNAIKYISKSNKTLTLQSCNNSIELHKIYPHILSKLIDNYKL